MSEEAAGTAAAVTQVASAATEAAEHPAAEKKIYQLPLDKLENTLPADHKDGTFIGRVMLAEGPAVVKLDSDGYLVDITRTYNTVSKLCEQENPAEAARFAMGHRIGKFSEIIANTPLHAQKEGKPYLISPIDLQAVKAAGVTFPVSMIERTIEEKCKGDPTKAAEVRAQIYADIEKVLCGKKLTEIKPGSDEALALKKHLVETLGFSPHYLEVGLGKDAEIFTKAQPMSTIGHGAHAGLHPESKWNNPEPEVAVITNSRGRIVGATLGNDVNLRDFEGRSALLLGECKDQNASACLGPMIRLIDGNSFKLDHIRNMDVEVHVKGDDGFALDDKSSMSQIRRDPQDELVKQMFSQHQYPDGAVLYCGTMFAPTKIRDPQNPKNGFTHRLGDIVTIKSDKLGELTNVMASTKDAPEWTMGAGKLMENLMERGLLTPKGMSLVPEVGRQRSAGRAA